MSLNYKKYISDIWGLLTCFHLIKVQFELLSTFLAFSGLWILQVWSASYTSQFGQLRFLGSVDIGIFL